MKKKKEKDTAVLILNMRTHKITRATTPYAKRYWANLDRVTAEVRRWPKWMRDIKLGDAK
jgi:hypothetical protein